jgi:hypothetical protein
MFPNVIPVSVVLDGRLVLGSTAAALVGGTVTVPLDPYVRRLTDRIVVDALQGTIVLGRSATSLGLRLGERSAQTANGVLTLPIAPYVRDDTTYIPLAAVARALGDAVSYDARARVISIVSAPTEPLATMTPYVPQSPAPSPISTFTPQPVPTPRPTVSGIPQPRRTPIEAGPAAGG